MTELHGIKVDDEPQAEAPLVATPEVLEMVRQLIDDVARNVANYVMAIDPRFAPEPLAAAAFALGKVAGLFFAPQPELIVAAMFGKMQEGCMQMAALSAEDKAKLQQQIVEQIRKAQSKIILPHGPNHRNGFHR